ncbi:hypothetical protein KFZ56_04140 [Virgibacillus sp. NKC19-3]|uniref:hypothetical protein n=1 Tax=Virgibacillus saliphilus TaxID=2831674 RepID=UPI001C9BAC2D|nr:hypothetical protein [Virgibacillus sp. NKC19-3]MBY7142295.1 hypothetical protein [Virgibacillus sp. NKC19-3]
MKYRSLTSYLYIFYAIIFAIYIVNVFMENETINYILGILAIFMVIFSFPLASRLFKVLGSTFILIGGFFYLQTDESIIDLPKILTSNMSLLVLLSMLPWMSSVVRSGRFDKSLNALMKVNVSDLGKLYARSTTTTLTLAAFLNLSAATISQDVLKDNLSHVNRKLRNSFISISTLRGFSLALLWSPLEILLAVTIFETGVSYVTLLPWLLIIAVTTFMLDAIWGRYHYKRYSYVSDQGTSSVSTHIHGTGKKIFYLAVALTLFLSLVILIGNLFNLDFILAVSLLIFPFSFVWSMIMRRIHSFWVIGWNTWKNKTNTMQNFIILFISLSLFSNSIGNTTFLEYVQQPVIALSEYPLLVFFLMQLIFLFMSMFGVHPVATIGILSSLLSTLLTIYNPLSIAIVMITSAIATLTVGTYGLVVTVTAVNLEINPYRITVSNLLYSLVYGGIGSIVAYLLL